MFLPANVEEPAERPEGAPPEERACKVHRAERTRHQWCKARRNHPSRMQHPGALKCVQHSELHAECFQCFQQHQSPAPPPSLSQKEKTEKPVCLPLSAPASLTHSPSPFCCPARQQMRPYQWDQRPFHTTEPKRWRHCVLAVLSTLAGMACDCYKASLPQTLCSRLRSQAAVARAPQPPRHTRDTATILQQMISDASRISRLQALAHTTTAGCTSLAAWLVAAMQTTVGCSKPC